MKEEKLQSALDSASDQPNVISSPEDDDNENELTLEEQILKNQSLNTNLVDTIVHFVGDKTTIGQIVQLLAYIRHAVKNNIETDINVSICKNVVGTELMFDVNGQQINDYKTQPHADIN